MVMYEFLQHFGINLLCVLFNKGDVCLHNGYGEVLESEIRVNFVNLSV